MHPELGCQLSLAQIYLQAVFSKELREGLGRIGSRWRIPLMARITKWQKGRITALSASFQFPTANFITRGARNSPRAA